ncbi:hypothetical protein C8J56DRAFT_1171986 [Mycena floridula]|nr:hypothetical protein C8J56DRAFT_1171986 [Mycena floridula]
MLPVPLHRWEQIPKILYRTFVDLAISDDSSTNGLSTRFTESRSYTTNQAFGEVFGVSSVPPLALGPITNRQLARAIKGLQASKSLLRISALPIDNYNSFSGAISLQPLARDLNLEEIFSKQRRLGAWSLQTPQSWRLLSSESALAPPDLLAPAVSKIMAIYERVPRAILVRHFTVSETLLTAKSWRMPKRPHFIRPKPLWAHPRREVKDSSPKTPLWPPLAQIFYNKPLYAFKIILPYQNIIYIDRYPFGGDQNFVILENDLGGSFDAGSIQLRSGGFRFCCQSYYRRAAHTHADQNFQQLSRLGVAAQPQRSWTTGKQRIGTELG